MGDCLVFDRDLSVPVQPDSSSCLRERPPGGAKYGIHMRSLVSLLLDVDVMAAKLLQQLFVCTLCGPRYTVYRTGPADAYDIVDHAIWLCGMVTTNQRRIVLRQHLFTVNPPLRFNNKTTNFSLISVLLVMPAHTHTHTKAKATRVSQRTTRMFTIVFPCCWIPV